ncbi:MAG: LysM peptidoglycan-binding domain-containing protein [Heyndrickxia sp.]
MKESRLRNSFAGIIMSTTIFSTAMIGNSPVEASTNSSKFNMSYLFFGTKGSYFNQVEATKGSLNVVAPNYFELSKDGSLIITSKFDQTFIDEMHRQGLKVVPYISNNWDRAIGRAGLANRQNLVKELVDSINKFHLDGVDVDIEGLTEADRTTFTEFITELNKQIPDKEVSVAVAANPGAWTTGWQGMYDYKALSLNSDYLMIMAYDENWDGDPTNGPVAGLPWVERSIQYALNQGVSEDNIVLGIPFYGRIWKTDGPTSNGTIVNGTGVSHKLISNIIQAYNGKIDIDTVEQCPKVTFTIKPTDPTTKVGGVELTAGNYILWYDNQESITKKIQLVTKYNLKGTGSWSLNQEDPEMWGYFRNVLDQNSGTTNPQSSPVEPQTSVTYKVVSGDSLSKIAKQNNITVQALKSANNLTSDTIKIGQVLVIPVGEVKTPITPNKPVEPSKPAETQTPPKTSTQVKQAPPKIITKTVTKTITKTVKYKVLRGDSLSKIAKKYKITVSQIMKDNKLKSSKIRIGQYLTIHYKTTVKTTVKVQAPTVKTTSALPKTIKYKVVKGDSLYKIATKYKVSISLIKKTNKLKSNTIRIGQVLSIQK